MVKKSLILAIIFVVFSFLLKIISTQHDVPLKRPFKLFPYKIDSFNLKTTKNMKPEIIKALGVSDYIIRVYCKENHCIELYVGFFKSQREGAMIHSPKHCMPGSGWIPLSSEIITLKTKNGEIRVNRFLLQKGEEKLLVYYWYQGRGRILASEYKDRLYLLLDRILKKRSDGALVRLTVPYRPGEEKQLRLFINHLLPVLNKFLPS